MTFIKSKIFLTIFCLFEFSCIVNKPTIVHKSKIDFEVDTNNLKRQVENLVNFKPSRCYQNPTNLNNSAEYIYNEFLKTSSFVEFQKFKGIYGVDTFKNIIASYNTDCQNRIIIGAHYDTFPTTPGADDNASGVAGILEIARLIKFYSPKLNYRVDLIAFCNEEPPFFHSDYMGSFVHAKTMKDSLVNIKLAIVFDMIGFFSEVKNSQRVPNKLLYLFYPRKANFIVLVGKMGKYKISCDFKKKYNSVSDVKMKTLNIPENIKAGKNSDHGSYWDFDFQSVLLTNTATFRNSNYHEETDLPETLDYEKMGEVVKGTYYFLINYENDK
jgi:hypothetical protein